VKVGETAKGKPIYDYQGVAFHAFRKACGSLLLAHGKSLKQVQGWLRHSQLATTLNIYIHQVDDGLGSAHAWDDILGDTRGPTWGHRWGHRTPGDSRKPACARNRESGGLAGERFNSRKRPQPLGRTHNR
jgi:Phage integrase family